SPLAPVIRTRIADSPPRIQLHVVHLACIFNVIFLPFSSRRIRRAHASTLVGLAMMAKRHCFSLLPSSLLAALVVYVAPLRAEKPPEADVARRVDEAIAKALPGSRPAVVDDATYFRRVSLDLTGKLPDADEVRAFIDQTDAAKRVKLTNRL